MITLAIFLQVSEYDKEEITPVIPSMMKRGELNLLLNVPPLLYYTLDLGIDCLVIQDVILPAFLAKAFA